MLTEGFIQTIASHRSLRSVLYIEPASLFIARFLLRDDLYKTPPLRVSGPVDACICMLVSGPCHLLGDLYTRYGSEDRKRCRSNILSSLKWLRFLYTVVLRGDNTGGGPYGRRLVLPKQVRHMVRLPCNLGYGIANDHSDSKALYPHEVLGVIGFARSDEERLMVAMYMSTGSRPCGLRCLQL